MCQRTHDPVFPVDCVGAWQQMAKGLAPQNIQTWTLPGERTKNGRSHIVHLPVLATEIIEKLPRMASEKGWVFTTPRPVVDKILNRSSGKIAGVAKIYNRFEYPPNGRLRSRQGPTT